MTIRECYDLMGEDFNDVMGRLQREILVEKFFLRFEFDNSMDLLHTSIENNDIEGCFRAAHTLKSVSGNLSLGKLCKAADALTEQLRSRTEAPDPALVKEVEVSYGKVISALNTFKAQKED